MKKTIALLLCLILILASVPAAYGADTGARRNLKTSTLSESDKVNTYSGIRVNLSVPNYLGKIKANITTTDFQGETEVLVIYVPNDKWDGNCYYNGVIGNVKQGLTRISTNSGSLVSWMDLYSYNFLPLEGGFFYVDSNSLQMSFLSGPGLYTGLATFSFTHDGKEEMSAAGYPFILILNDDTIDYYLEHGKLDSYASYDWPELAKLLKEPEDTTSGLSNFKNVRNYFRGTYNDVELPGPAWYDEYVISCYRQGLMEGNNFKFNPNSPFTLAQAITVAARIHNIYYGGSGKFNEGPIWYSVYVRYAISNGIIYSEDFGAEELGMSAYNRPATRGEMAYIFAHTLPSAALKSINTVKRIPDVSSGSAFSSEIFTLYKAGILDGYTANHYFRASNNITRGEASAIISRLVNQSSRLQFSIY